MYRVVTDEQVTVQLDGMPAAGSAAFAELRVALGVGPWGVGASINPANPDAEVRVVSFGAHREGLLVFMVLERRHRVELLQLSWLG